MQKSDNNSYAFFAGVCYAIYGLYEIITRCISAQNSGDGSLKPLDFILFVAVFGMAVALFLKEEKGVVAAAGVYALLELFYLFYQDVVEMFFEMFFYDLFHFISYTLVIALILLTLKKNAIAQKIWFAPDAARVLSFLFILDGYIFFLLNYGTWRLLCYLAEIGGLILIGLWVKEHDFVLSKNEPTNEDSKSDLQAVYSAPLSDTAIEGADELKMYSELLESGIITQEEFDAKKKQFLGL